MMIGIFEGAARCFEVVARAEGYVVQPRDLRTKRLEDRERTVFRTAVVAFAFADLSAGFDRAAAANLAGHQQAKVLRLRQRAFHDVSRQLLDGGFDASVLDAWDTHDSERAQRRLH